VIEERVVEIEQNCTGSVLSVHTFIIEVSRNSSMVD
jgi:hypothetical protein